MLPYTPLGPYVPATVAGDVVYTSGQIAIDAETGKIVGEDIRTQTRQALNNLRAVLAAAGSSLELTLRVNVYLKNPEDFPAMNEVYQEFFRDHKPARTTVPWSGVGQGCADRGGCTCVARCRLTFPGEMESPARSWRSAETRLRLPGTAERKARHCRAF